MQEAAQGNNFYRATGRFLRRRGHSRADSPQEFTGVEGSSQGQDTGALSTGIDKRVPASGLEERV